MDDKSCRVGMLYFRDQSQEAKACAEKLTKETGKSHAVEETCEFLTDGLGHVVRCYLKIVAGRSHEKKD